MIALVLFDLLANQEANAKPHPQAVTPSTEQSVQKKDTKQIVINVTIIPYHMTKAHRIISVARWATGATK